MKLRIKGNSIRLRLSKTDVTVLHDTGYIEEQTLFAANKFMYALQCSENVHELSATFSNNKMIVYIPTAWTRDWPMNDTVGFDSRIKLTETDSLYILVEKDFICLDETVEDQSDNYENPNKAC